MIVCVCRRVSDREIAQHTRAGLGFEEIQNGLGVATCCGRCADAAREVIAQAAAPAPVVAFPDSSVPRVFAPSNSNA